MEVLDGFGSAEPTELVAAADAPGCESFSSQFLPPPPMPC
jgi:hypothetical protein